MFLFKCYLKKYYSLLQILHILILNIFVNSQIFLSIPHLYTADLVRTNQSYFKSPSV